MDERKIDTNAPEPLPEQERDSRCLLPRCQIKWMCRIIQKQLLPIFCFFLCGVLLIVGLFFGISSAVCHRTAPRIRTSEELAASGMHFDYILVLGCRVYADGTPSAMLYDRVSVGAALYEAGVCDRILMSGDSRSPYYDEVSAMVDTGVSLGVPQEAILTDRYGLSTYDSIARMLALYQGKRVVIVTQEYHLYRALYVAEKLGVDAYGVSADLRPYSKQLSRELREVLARCKDVYYALQQPPYALEP